MPTVCDAIDCARSAGHPGDHDFGPANPWQDVAPFCPVGHYPRRVVRWSYDPDDQAPWLCVPCKRRFRVTT